jgi:hypothetical protein
VAGDATGAVHLHVHAPAGQRDRRTGGTRGGEIDPLAVTLKPGRPVLTAHSRTEEGRAGGAIDDRNGNQNKATGNGKSAHPSFIRHWSFFPDGLAPGNRDPDVISPWQGLEALCRLKALRRDGEQTAGDEF